MSSAPRRRPPTRSTPNATAEASVAASSTTHAATKPSPTERTRAPSRKGTTKIASRETEKSKVATRRSGKQRSESAAESAPTNPVQEEPAKPIPERKRRKRKAREMEQQTPAAQEAAQVPTTSTPAVPIVGSHKNKRAKTDEPSVDDDHMDDGEHTGSDDAAQFLFGAPAEDESMSNEAGGTPSKDADERARLQSLLMKFGSPQDFNPMTNMNSSQWDAVLEGLLNPDPSFQLTALMDLHASLSVCSEDTLHSFRWDKFIPALLTMFQTNQFGDETFSLLSIQCFVYLVDSYPPAGSFLVRYGVIPSVCEKLLGIESIDVAEHCIKLLSMLCEHAATGIHVLRAGGLTALLGFLDFFPSDTQLRAVTAAANMTRHIPKELFSTAADSVENFLNLTESHDPKIVEKAVLALSRLVEHFRADADRMKSLPITRLIKNLVQNMSISSSGVTPESASAANLAVKTLSTLCRTNPSVIMSLLEQNVPQILRSLLNLEQEFAKTKAAQANKMFSAQHVYDIMSLISHMLPTLPSEMSALLHTHHRKPSSGSEAGSPAGALLRALNARLQNALGGGGSGDAEQAENEDEVNEGGDEGEAPEGGLFGSSPPAKPAAAKPETEKKSKRVDERTKLFSAKPELLFSFAEILLPSLLRVYGATINQAVRYKCLISIAKLIHHAPPQVLTETLRDLTVSAFVASLLASKDLNICETALRMAADLMEKLPEIFSEYFIREGVVHEVVKLIKSIESSLAGNPSLPATPATPGTEASQAEVVVGSPAGPSFGEDPLALAAAALGLAPPPVPVAKTPTKQQENARKELVLVLAKSFKEKYFPASDSNDSGSVNSALKQFKSLSQGIRDSIGKDDATMENALKLFAEFLCSGGVSTFELLQSGVCEELLNFLVVGGVSAAKRFISAFSSTASVAPSMSSPSSARPESLTAVAVLVREIHRAIEKVEHFPVALNPSGGSGSSGLKYLTYPFKVQLKRAEGETTLRSYGDAVIMVEPLATIQAVKEFLRTRLIQSEEKKGEGQTEEQAEDKMNVDESSEKKDENSGDEQDENHGNDEENEEEEEGDIIGDDDMMEDEPNADEDNPDAHTDQNVQNVEVSEDQSSRGDLNEPEAPAQETTYTDTDEQAQTPAGTEIEFLLDGQEISDLNTVFQVLHEGAVRKQQEKYRQESNGVDPSADSFDLPLPSLTKLWESTYLLEYRLKPKTLSSSSNIAIPTSSVDIASSSSSSSSNSKPLTAIEILTNGIGSLLQTLDESHPGTKQRAELLRACCGDEPTSTLLLLLRIIFEINNSAPLLAGKASQPLLQSRDFVNPKLTSKLMRQLQDALMVCAGSLPPWCRVLISSHRFQFLFPFEMRQLYFRATSLGISRALSALQEQLHEATDIRIGRIPRQKYRISRERLLDSAAKVLQLVRGNRGILEVEYFDESGTGLGPTLEFFTLVCREIQRKNLKIWIDATRNGETDWVDAPGGLFPRPLKQSDISETILKHFEFVGSFTAKAMYDNRLLDIPFSGAVLKKMLGFNIDLNDIKAVAPEITKALFSFIDIVKDRDAGKPVDAAKVDDLYLHFTFPGDESWELKENGASTPVTLQNLHEYVALVADALLNIGVRKQFEAFQRGFDAIFPIKSIRSFTSEELDSLLCGSMQDSQPWDRMTLLENTKFDKGYSSSSKVSGYLLEVLGELTPDQRRKFLKFSTGSSRLPPRGFKDMNPKLTFIRKETSAPLSPDEFLPSANTCFAILKLPEYSSKEVLKKRLLFAIENGQEAFSLS